MPHREKRNHRQDQEVDTASIHKGGVEQLTIFYSSKRDDKDHSQRAKKYLSYEINQS